MPSEEHIRRQIEWSDKLKEFGCEASLEESIRIEGARVVPDVLAKAESKTFLIEIGNIDDERKTALMRLYAERNPNIEFIHEPYGSDKMNGVLESLNAYRNSAEYKRLIKQKRLLERQRRNAELEDRKFKRYVLYTILVIWFVPSIALMFVDTILALGWFVLCFGMLFILPFVLLFLFPPVALEFFSTLSSLFGSLKEPTKEKSTEETERKLTEQLEESEVKELELDHKCPQCGQPCTKEEYESGYCLDCDQIEMNLFEE